MKKIIVIGLCCLLPVLIFGILALSRQKNFPLRIQNTRVSSIPEGNTVIYSDSGHSPFTITVKVGTTVVFKNDSTRPMWPASDIHPLHTAYPGSGIHKCDVEPAEILFDSCAAINLESSWSFQFNEIGTWKYHDHLTPRYAGTIVVSK